MFARKREMRAPKPKEKRPPPLAQCERGARKLNLSAAERRLCADSQQKAADWGALLLLAPAHSPPASLLRLSCSSTRANSNPIRAGLCAPCELVCALIGTNWSARHKNRAWASLVGARHVRRDPICGWRARRALQTEMERLRWSEVATFAASPSQLVLRRERETSAEFSLGLIQLSDLHLFARAIRTPNWSASLC